MKKSYLTSHSGKENKTRPISTWRHDWRDWKLENSPKKIHLRREFLVQREPQERNFMQLHSSVFPKWQRKMSWNFFSILNLLFSRFFSFNLKFDMLKWHLGMRIDLIGSQEFFRAPRLSCTFISNQLIILKLFIDLRLPDWIRSAS